MDPNWGLLSENFANFTIGGASTSPSYHHNAAHDDSIWDIDYRPLNRGGVLPSEMLDLGSSSSSYYGENQDLDFQRQNEYLSAGGLTGQRSVYPLSGHSSAHAVPNHYDTGLQSLYGRSSVPPGLDMTEYYLTRLTANYGLLPGSRHDTVSGELRNRSGLSIQGGSTPKRIQELLSTLRGKICLLMLDESKCPLFDVLVDGCEGEHLDILLWEVFSKSHMLVAAAFTMEGSNSIMNLIKKLEKTVHAFTLAKILSERFYDIATHPTARNVIQQCLKIFDIGPNKVLYEQIMDYFQSLAVNPTGCKFLNDCIDIIPENQRMVLLGHVARNSDHLSNDPYGNYVVQHALAQSISVITEKILTRLRGRFMSLARKKLASNVVEKCLESSDRGIMIVVNEILRNHQGPFELAKDQYGNYVIQKALRLTKEHGHSELYESLSAALRPYSSELKLTSGGKCVMNIVERGGRYRARSNYHPTQSEMLMYSDYPGLQQPLAFL